MDQLPIILISKQLKYVLAAQKIKTLQKARQILPRFKEDELKYKKVVNIVQKYDQINQRVKNIMDETQYTVFQDQAQRKIMQIMEEQQNQGNLQINKNKQDIFMKMIKQPKLIQIYGDKGTGKTSFILYLVAQYREQFPNNPITIFNCATGITKSRLQNLTNCNHYDIFSSQEGIGYCKKMMFQQDEKDKVQQAKDQNKIKKKPKKFFKSTALVVIDSITNFFLGEQKIKSSITNFFNALQQLKIKYGVTILLTNYLYQKIEYKIKNFQDENVLADKNQNKFQSQRHVFNHQSYFNFYHAEYIDHKIFLEKVKKENFGETGFLIRGVKGRQFEGKFFIGNQGLQQIFISKIW